MGSTSNAGVGAMFERQLCELLSRSGFWVHRITPNAAGQQPADIIAVRRKYHTLIDCKVITTQNGFPFSRVEDNQRLAMEMFDRRAVETPWFAIRLPGGDIRMLSYIRLLNLENLGTKFLSNVELMHDNYTTAFKDWLRRVESWM